MFETEFTNNHSSKSILTSITDDQVIQLVCSGKIQAFETIMRRYNQQLFRITRSILLNDDLAQDAIQETYISAYLRISSYTPAGKFGAWLTRIAINEALMIKRKSKKYLNHQIHDENIDSQEGDYNNEEPANVAASKQVMIMIEHCIDKLPDDLRLVFVLRAIQQLSTKETAAILDINPGTVKTRFLRARDRMQQELSKQFDILQSNAYEFAGKRCDNVVNNVFKRLNILVNSDKDNELIH